MTETPVPAGPPGREPGSDTETPAPAGTVATDRPEEAPGGPAGRASGFLSVDEGGPGPERMRRLLIVRHGQTPSNVMHALDTRAPGAPLTVLGRKQADAVGEEIATAGFDPTVIYSSEAERAKQTARVIADKVGVNAEALPDALEIQAGDYEMHSSGEALLAYNRLVRDWVEQGELSSRLPGGESGFEVRDRLLPVIDSLRRDHLEADEPRDAVIVIHGALMRVVATFLGAASAEYAMSNRMPNCGVIELEAVGDEWICHSWAEHRPAPR